MAHSIQKDNRVQVGQVLRNHPIIVSTVIAGLTVVMVAQLLQPHFGSNDDTMMKLTANGYLYGEPAPQLVYTSTAIGAVLAGLYRLAPSIPWYGGYLYSAHAAAFTALLYLIMVRRFGWRGSVGFGGFVFAFVLPALIHLQFTSASMLLGSAAILLHLLTDHRRSVAVSIWAGVLIGVSGLIRLEGLVAIVLVALPVVMLRFMAIPLRRHAVVALSIVAVLGVGFAADAYNYRDPAWSEYLAFNSARSAIIDRPGSAGNVGPEFLEELGMSRNDVDMLGSWFFLDPDVYSLDNVEALARTPSWRRNPLVAFRNAVVAVPWQLGFAGALLVASLLSATRIERFAVSGVTALGTVLAGYLGVFVKLPERVLLPLVAFVGICLLLIPERFPAGARPRYRRTVSLLLVLSSGIMIASGLVMAAQEATSSRNATAYPLRVFETLAARTDLVFFNWANTLPWTGLPIGSEDLPSAAIVNLGWPARSPLHQNALEGLGIGDPYLAIASNPNVLLLIPSSRAYEALYESYMEEHYGMNGRLTLDASLELGGGIKAYSVLEPEG